MSLDKRKLTSRHRQPRSIGRPFLEREWSLTRSAFEGTRLLQNCAPFYESTNRLEQAAELKKALARR